MENGMTADEISKLTYSSFSCERDENTPGVRFCILFEPRNLKNEEGKKTSCHPKITVVRSPGYGGRGRYPC